MTAQVLDAWDSADDPKFGSNEFWGLCNISTYFAVLVKGTGKVQFDPHTHTADQRVTAVDICITPIVEQGARYAIERSLIAESREWASITLPSIKALGLSAREIDGKYVKITLKPTGRFYTNSQGETKERTAIEFQRAFASENDCKADYLAGSTPQPESTQSAPTSGNGKDRATAQAFLRPIVESACRGQNDVNTVRATITANLANYPMVSKYFTADSPEVATLISEFLK